MTMDTSQSKPMHVYLKREPSILKIPTKLPLQWHIFPGYIYEEGKIKVTAVSLLVRKSFKIYSHPKQVGHARPSCASRRGCVSREGCSTDRRPHRPRRTRTSCSTQPGSKPDHPDSRGLRWVRQLSGGRRCCRRDSSTRNSAAIDATVPDQCAA